MENIAENLEKYKKESTKLSKELKASIDLALTHKCNALKALQNKDLPEYRIQLSLYHTYGTNVLNTAEKLSQYTVDFCIKSFGIMKEGAKELQKEQDNCMLEMAKNFNTERN